MYNKWCVYAGKKLIIWSLKFFFFVFFHWIKDADEECDVIIDIFNFLVAPCILQSHNGREFVTKIIDSLFNTWSNFKIVYGKLQVRVVSKDQNHLPVEKGTPTRIPVPGGDRRRGVARHILATVLEERIYLS